METDNKKLMSISEVAKYLGISRYGVIQLIKTNVVKAVDIGKKKYIVARLWCNGSTTDFDSVRIGSNPVSPAKYKDKHTLFFWQSGKTLDISDRRKYADVVYRLILQPSKLIRWVRLPSSAFTSIILLLSLVMLTNRNRRLTCWTDSIISGYSAVGSAPVLGTGCRGFESLCSDSLRM